MPRFAANLSMMYNEVPFLERFAACARDGFQGVEFLFPYAFPAEAIAAELERHGLQQVLFNTVPGAFEAGERGLASLPGREAEFLAGVDRAIEYAIALRCPRLHAMAGIAPPDADRGERREVYVGNLREAATRCAKHGITLLIEPINTRDIPGFFLNRQADAHAVVGDVGAGNLKVQMDLYHCQIVEGDLAMRIRQHLAGVGHVQIAGVPERHEPDVGEINYRYLFALLDELGYDGWIGCEYRPRAGTSAGLGWLRPYLSQ
jgi:2-dehydrotetronate isomerase